MITTPNQLSKHQTSNTEISNAEKIKLAKQAYAEYLHLLYQLSEEEKAALDQEVKALEQQRIVQVKQAIASLHVS